VTLSDCKFVTQPPQLGIEKEFEASCQAKWPGTTPPENLRVSFKIVMKWD